MTDERFEELMRDAADTYHRPPAAPPEAIWRGVERHLDMGTAGARGRVRWRPAHWLAIAATLVAGIGIGRLTTPVGPAGGGAAGSSQDVAAAPQAAHPSAAPLLPTADRYLSQTAALLIALPREPGSASADERLSRQAADLLATTRLLLDSPAASDPRLHALLEDLELVLAQIARLPNERGRQDLELINQALEQRDVIPRLRDAVADLSTE